MTTEHPITLPPELVGEWLCDDGYPWDPSGDVTITITTNRLRNVATQAARWGADQELEACCDQLKRWGFPCAENLHNTRRSKSLSLKEQALKQLECVDGILRNQGMIKTDTIRRALEALPE